MTLIKATISALVLCFSLSADINVSYTVTGSPGDYTLDFSVNNAIVGAPNQDLYFFGVDLSSTNITGSPASFSTFAAYNPFTEGGGIGANITYNNVWLVSTFPTVGTTALPGTTTSGFDVTITDTVAPTSVNWFAVTDGTDLYSGSGNLNPSRPDNPLFEGTATETTSTTPEPSTLAFLGAGLAGIVALRRHKTA